MATEQDKTAEALKIAIQMEIDGKEFYRKASQESRNDPGKKLMKSLSDEEDVHRQKFEEIYESIRSKNEWPEVEFHPDDGQSLKTMFARATASIDSSVNVSATELDAVQTAMDMENKTYDFYIEHSKSAAYDTEKKYYQALAVQERAHHAVLLDYYEFLKNPGAWFVQKEHPSLDGG